MLTQSPNLGASAAEVWEKRQTRRPGWAIRETWMGFAGMGAQRRPACNECCSDFLGLKGPTD